MLDFFKDKDIIIHTRTLADYKNIVGYLLSIGLMWVLGKTDINSDLWFTYRDSTCVRICNNQIRYGSYNHYSSINYIILDIEDFYRDIKAKKTFDEFI